jgi:hypothetical protein
MPMAMPKLWHAFHGAHLPAPSPLPPVLRPDNPFVLNYVFVHHYRSLGWVVKTGIKFCVDYLLYKRGPVFHHAEYVRCLFLTPPTMRKGFRCAALLIYFCGEFLSGSFAGSATPIPAL